jgi:hypothetical protein
MIVRVKWLALKESRWHEYLLRFTLGGLATVLAGAVARFFGPDYGGLFLAFPAIFCASVTLIEKHERERKQKRGLLGNRRGADAAVLDATGAGLGSSGLVAFGLAIWLLAPDTGSEALAFGSIAWIVVSVLLWRLRRQIRIVR